MTRLPLIPFAGCGWRHSPAATAAASAVRTMAQGINASNGSQLAPRSSVIVIRLGLTGNPPSDDGGGRPRPLSTGHVTNGLGRRVLAVGLRHVKGECDGERITAAT